MKATRFVALCLMVVAPALPSFAAESNTSEQIAHELNIAVDGPGVVITSSNSSLALAARETAGPDTFAIYGGPDQPTEGKFELADGVTPDWGGGNELPGGGYGGGPDAWTPVDITDQPVYWHVDTHMAENLNNNGVGNQAIWSGLDAGDPLTGAWYHAPGYGNSWLDDLIYESAPVADPGQGETVGLDFFFNYDTEPGYDYFSAAFDSAGNWIELFTISGTSADTGGVLQPPGVQYSTLETRPITFAGNDFGGESRDQIRIRLRFSSDGAWSDQDGLWPTTSGAVQVDDISVTSSLGVAFEDFEGSSPYLFQPDKSPFAGDFADVYPRLVDLDPCRDNRTPMIGFIDYNQVVRNGPGIGGDVSTGGSTSAGIDYGIVGNWVTNYGGGLSFGELQLANEVWSPDILWDLDGPDDDGVAVSGAFIRFTVWVDLPVNVGIFYRWQVRSAPAGESYGSWNSRNFVYHGSGVPSWTQSRFDVSDLLQASPERVQFALGCWDFAETFGFPGNSARPSPVFDNAAFYKYRIAGPSLSTRTIDLAQDGFPINGSIDVGTQASRDALDIPFSMARDVNSSWGASNTPGDSVIVDVAALIPGTAMTDIRMVWALSKNPLFEDAIRSAPDRLVDQNVVLGPDAWTGEVIAGVSTTSSGFVIANRFYMDVPDVDFMYPGDVLHYYFRSSDDGGFTSTLPADISGFGSFGPTATYDRSFTVRGLPSIMDAAGAQPEILILNDFGRRGGENDFMTSMQQLGYREGIDFDTYTTQGPSSGVSNGIGSSGAHGAEAGQLVGYHHMLYFLGNLNSLSLSNGSNNGTNDKGNDIDVLEQWHALPGVRNIAYFGNDLATSLIYGSSEGLSYLNNTMGVDWLGEDVAGVIGNQTTPMVVPNAEGIYEVHFGTDFVAYGACFTLNEFDYIQPLAGSEVGHYFADTSGAPITSKAAGVASVIHPTANGLDITFPYSMMYVYDIVGRASVGVSKRTALFREVFSLFGTNIIIGPIVSAPAQKNVELSVFPNPFNPSTVVEFTATPGSRGSVRVFNLRGELVRTLHSGEFQTSQFRWDGTDQRGAAVASGVYVVQADMEGAKQTRKVALVK